jgi:aromatic-amino-acid transaminase
MVSIFSQMQMQPADPLLRLITEFRDDPRTDKIDLGVGVYRDETGATPVMRAVKFAERKLCDQQASKAYLGPEGNLGFASALKRLVTGDDACVSCIQTPGGTGALRLAMDVIAHTRPGATVWVGMPTWPNHTALLQAAGLHVRPYRYLTHAEVNFTAMMAELEKAEAGDIVLLHGCCHNPSGVDLSPDQWEQLAELLRARGLMPLIDLAYQGLGDGFEADAGPALKLLCHCGEGFLAYSCDKNFALYRERVGALFVRTPQAGIAETVFSNLLKAARTNWSMPPDHGGAVVQIVLDDPVLRADWQGELTSMRNRINGLRRAVAVAAPRLGFLAQQKGLFSLLPLTPEAVDRIKKRHGVYMAASGRINVAGLTLEMIPRFVEAYDDVVAL